MGFFFWIFFSGQKYPKKKISIFSCNKNGKKYPKKYQKKYPKKYPKKNPDFFQIFLDKRS